MELVEAAYVCVCEGEGKGEAKRGVKASRETSR